MLNNQITTRADKRLKGYFEHRYRNNSYKARKYGIGIPILMMAKRGGDRLRLYGEMVSDRQVQIAKDIFKGWKQKERELRRLDKLNRRYPGKQSATVPVGLAG